jgi:protein ImuB
MAALDTGLSSGIMSRIVSVWLKAWPIARLLRTQASAAPADAIDPHQPLVLVAPGKGGARIVALNRAARHGGLVTGDLLSNARSKVLQLQSLDADPAADAAALDKLALWALRYTPIAAAWDQESGADGFFLDITGCAHLFGGEEPMLADLASRLRGFGLRAKLAVADTAGASWAMARCARAELAIVPPGGATEALRPLPVTGLRLSEEIQGLLRRLGFRRIGELIDQPRAPFAARFEEDYLRRLDQALGREPEPLVPVVPSPVYRAQTQFLEPIMSADHVLQAATHLLQDLVPALAHDDAGVRQLRLLLFRVDGGVATVELGLAAPSRDPTHIAKLIELRIARMGSELDAEFGFEAAAMHVVVAEPLRARQSALLVDDHNPAPDGLAHLIDRLQQRLGPGAVQRLHSRQSHIPERAEQARVAGPEPSAEDVLPAEGAANAPCAPRPLLLLPRPEVAEVLALIPDGPPRRFRWRGVMHQVAQVDGPERVTPEWWRRTEEAERDYFVVEDTDGRRFWLYREGLYESAAAMPAWYVHGLFA